MKKAIILFASALALSAGAFAQDSKPAFKWYGFVRTYFAYDTRESTAGTEDLYFYMPKDESINASGEDVNAIPSFRYAALTSRLGLDVTGYQVAGYNIGAKIETDFYSGVSGTTGTATLRMRQAYMTVAKGGRSWKIGQAWTPMAADLPDIFSLESGAPFGPFSRSPQVTFDGKISDAVSLTASAIWQMQYTSTGPSGNSANYIKYSCIPELYLGLNLKGEKGLFRLGAEYLNIKPRNVNAAGSKTSDRIGMVNVFEYGQLKAGGWTLKEKVTYANDGSHMNLIGGYGVSKVNSDGSWEYSATRNISGWFTAQYKPKDSKWTPQILLGYIKNFGTADPIVGEFWCKNNAGSVARMYRIQPEIVYNLGKVQFGLEYMLTAAQYGKANSNKLAVENLHWVSNNRIQMMLKYTF